MVLDINNTYFKYVLVLLNVKFRGELEISHILNFENSFKKLYGFKGYFMARKSRLSYGGIGVGYTKYRKLKITHSNLYFQIKPLYAYKYYICIWRLFVK